MTAQRKRSGDVDLASWAPEPTAESPRRREPFDGASADLCRLELGERGEHLRLKAPGRGREVEPLAQRDDGAPGTVQAVEPHQDVER